MKLPITLILILFLLLWLGIQEIKKNRQPRCPEGSYWTGYVCYSPEVGG